ncbi:MAG: ATP synthase F1 subunit delta, partial [Bacteroidales bacterium]
MNDSKISVRYAKALFEAALDKGILDRVNKDMLLISEVCRIPVVKEILNNPVIVPSKKAGILHKIFDSKLQDITHSLIDLVVRNNRETYLPAIARVFIHDTLEHNGITESVLTTAIKVDD